MEPSTAGTTATSTQEEHGQRVLELKRQDWSFREIATEVGCHSATVSKWLADRGQGRRSLGLFQPPQSRRGVFSSSG